MLDSFFLQIYLTECKVDDKMNEYIVRQAMIILKSNLEDNDE